MPLYCTSSRGRQIRLQIAVAVCNELHVLLLSSGVPVGSDHDVDELERAGESLPVGSELPNLLFLNVDGNCTCAVQELCNSV